MITEQQRLARRLGIGGSDMAAILGLSSYKTPYQLYLEKIGDQQVIADEVETDVQRRGNLLEAVARAEFEHEFGVKVVESDTLIHPVYPFLRGNIDGFVPELNAVWEGKSSAPTNYKEWEFNGEHVIPFKHMTQLAHYCMLKNVDKAYITVFFNTIDVRHLVYERNLELEEFLITQAKIFWDCVQSKTPPAPISQIDLRLMYPKHNPEKSKTINTDIADQLTALAETRFKIKELSEVEDKHKFTIMQFMQDAECLVNESGQLSVSWKANKRGSRTFLLKGI